MDEDRNCLLCGHWFKCSEQFGAWKRVHSGEWMFEVEQRLSSGCQEEKVGSVKIVINRSWEAEQCQVTTTGQWAVAPTSRAPARFGKETVVGEEPQPPHTFFLPMLVWPTWCFCSSIRGRTFKPGKPPMQLALRIHGLYLVELFWNEVTLVGSSRQFRMKMLGKPDSNFLTLGSQCKFIYSFIHLFTHSASVEHLLSARHCAKIWEWNQTTEICCLASKGYNFLQWCSLTLPASLHRCLGILWLFKGPMASLLISMYPAYNGEGMLVVILESLDRVPHQAPCMKPASPSAFVSASVCLSWTNK